MNKWSFKNLRKQPAAPTPVPGRSGQQHVKCGCLGDVRIVPMPSSGQVQVEMWSVIAGAIIYVPFSRFISAPRAVIEGLANRVGAALPIPPPMASERLDGFGAATLQLNTNSNDGNAVTSLVQAVDVMLSVSDNVPSSPAEFEIRFYGPDGPSGMGADFAKATELTTGRIKFIPTQKEACVRVMLPYRVDGYIMPQLALIGPPLVEAGDPPVISDGNPSYLAANALTPTRLNTRPGDIVVQFYSGPASATCTAIAITSLATDGFAQ